MAGGSRPLATTLQLVSILPMLLASLQHAPSWNCFETEPRHAPAEPSRASPRCSPFGRARHHYRDERLGQGIGAQGLRRPGLLLRGQPSGWADPPFRGTDRAIVGD